MIAKIHMIEFVKRDCLEAKNPKEFVELWIVTSFKPCIKCPIKVQCKNNLKESYQEWEEES
jgi:hypothetical protein